MRRVFAVNRRALWRAGVPSGKNHSRGSLVLPLLLLPVLLAIASAAEAAKIRITVETPGGLQQNVYLTRPLGLAPERPVVFVFGGVGQSASEVRDRWHDLAVERDFLLVVPEFKGWQFPESGDYSLGNLFDAAGRLRPEREWFFTMIEPIFDDVRRRYGMTTDGYAMYGDAAGARFVQRCLYFIPKVRLTRAVAATADWYTMPSFDAHFPYGLSGTAVSPDQLVQALQSTLTILLDEPGAGEEHASPEPTAEILAQGPDGPARGQAFQAAAQVAAEAAGVTLGWQLVTVPGTTDPVGVRMAKAAIPYLLEP
jgi:hypothetical protein